MAVLVLVLVFVFVFVWDDLVDVVVLRVEVVDVDVGTDLIVLVDVVLLVDEVSMLATCL